MNFLLTLGDEVSLRFLAGTERMNKMKMAAAIVERSSLYKENIHNSQKDIDSMQPSYLYCFSIEDNNHL